MAGISLYRLPYHIFYEYTNHLSEEILKNGRPDEIVFMLRGGATIARALSDSLEIDSMIPFGCRLYSDIHERMDELVIYQDLTNDIRGRDILLVDDISDKGTSMEFTFNRLLKEEPKKIRTATMYIRKGTCFYPDYHTADAGKDWIIFPGEERETIRKLLKKGQERSLLDCFTKKDIEKVKYLDSIR